MEIKINKNTCKGCGLCAKVCTARLIDVKDKACIKEGNCNACYQCIAVCATEALSSEYCDPDEMLYYDKASFEISPENLINFMKTRRSIRVYQNKEIEYEKIMNIIEAGRYSPTGCNRQSLRFIIMCDKLEEFKRMCMYRTKEYVENTSEETDKLTPQKKEKFSLLYNLYIETGQDWLFFNAPVVLIIVADQRPGGDYTLDGGIAAANMALMAHANGLGACFVGNVKLAAEICPDLKEYLGLKEYEEIVTCMTLGYSNIKYQRTVGRKKANICIL